VRLKESNIRPSKELADRGLVFVNREQGVRVA